MKKMIYAICIGLAMCAVSTIRVSSAAQESSSPVEHASIVETPIAQHTILPAPVKKPRIQMAILLDTSGSMSGLIDQARAQLWSIVNEFILAKKDGVAPQFQLALYEYGKSSLAADEGYIRMILPFTTDLDKVSEELFALQTNGGSEYCGWVLQDATAGLNWSESADDLKVIFIAGNEPFTQGPVDYHKACKAAVTKGIIVNTIHCGSDSEGINGKWKDGAVLADGRYLCIDHNSAIVHIESPQDAEIARLNNELNSTYIPYGARGADFAGRQNRQDSNAAAASPQSVVQRTVSKSSIYYENSAWDLVDAVKNKKLEITEVKEKELPEEMQKMTDEERKAYVEQKTNQRTEIQTKIQKLNEERKKYVAEEMKKQSGGSETLGSAISQVVTQQAQSKNFRIEKPQTPQAN